MAFEQKEGQGSLFKNDKGNDRQPDSRGRIMIGGTVYEIAAWERTSKNGTSYLSLQAQLPREQSAQSQSATPPFQHSQVSAPPAYAAPFPTPQSEGMQDVEDDLPFD